MVYLLKRDESHLFLAGITGFSNLNTQHCTSRLCAQVAEMFHEDAYIQHLYSFAIIIQIKKKNKGLSVPREVNGYEL